MSTKYKPKADVYNKLKELTGVIVYQLRPEVLEDFPCVVFSIGNDNIMYFLSHDIAYQDIDLDIDIFAETSVETSGLLSDIEYKLRDLGYRLIQSRDVPDPDLISHVNARFNLSY